MSVDKMNTEQKMRNHFTFFRSFQEAIDQCEEKDQLTMYRGIVNYALDHVEPVFDNPLLKLAWTLIKPNLDKGIINWGNGCKGGAPLFNANAKKNNQETTEKQPKNNQETTEKQRDRKGMDRKGMDKEDKESKPKKDVSLSLADRKEAFKKELEQYRESYESDMLNDFFQYWTEPNKDQVMRFEDEEFWDTKAKLDAWKNRKFGK